MAAGAINDANFRPTMRSERSSQQQPTTSRQTMCIVDSLNEGVNEKGERCQCQKQQQQTIMSIKRGEIMENKTIKDEKKDNEDIKRHTTVVEIRGKEVKQIGSPECSDDNKINTDEPIPTNIGYQVDKEIKQKVKRMAQSYEPKTEKEVNREVHQILKDDIPVAQRPIRLALKEQQGVEKQAVKQLPVPKVEHRSGSRMQLTGELRCNPTNGIISECQSRIRRERRLQDNAHRKSRKLIKKIKRKEEKKMKRKKTRKKKRKEVILGERKIKVMMNK
ncbi:hypothetical protein JYU34_013916 [Plutella xylostella]|uniref:Uncharacterized protein n=1 Tax=Plutella xylostella TaxID=51655 RepID=A0ABQ7QAY0_PLUXY|nr:hypothetical protein JYU34_013916 [Plutella xylostella]